MSSPKQQFPIDVVRHSTAHLLAAALTDLYPGIKLGVGPVIENGFFYDVQTPQPITANDLPKIEKRMRKIAERSEAYSREEMPIEQAIAFFAEMGQTFKVELLTDLKEKGTTKVNPEELQEVDAARPDTASIYRTGKFVDLCRGPHVATTRDLGAFKLTKVSGAYWRGNEKNPQLTRIYGFAFATQEELDAHLKMMEEAEKRDHRKLGKELELFTVINEIGLGLPLFYPKGALLRRLVENYVIAEQEKRGYVPIWIPHITKGELYKISGHLDKYDAMYSPMKVDEDDYYLKPMNWTCTTTNYRYEKHGELAGLTRVRSLTQDDCHVFCMPDQIEKEISVMLEMIGKTYKIFGFKEFWVRISLRDPADPKKYLGGDDVWNMAENALRKVVTKTGWAHKEAKGEAAFYGPKLDFMLKDAIGREWQLSTIQLDFNLPERFALEYAGEDGGKHRPVVIHRAILGSTERFLGIMIEHYAGAFPTWLAPVQVQIIPVGKAHVRPGKKLEKLLLGTGIRAVCDDANESVGYKIRKAEKAKVPYMLVVGDKEKSLKKLTVRRRGEEKQKSMALGVFVKRLQKEIAAYK